MASRISKLAVAAILATSTSFAAAQSGSGHTTRYWDCCKPSCAWAGNAPAALAPVKTCDAHDNPLSDANAQSGCNGGNAYMCSDQSPWAVNHHLACGFASVNANNPACCTCYQLTFTSGPIKGKEMIVQATNTGYDVGSSQFDIAMPGGGFGIFNGCSTEWGATSDVWGAQYGGPSTDKCSRFPSKLRSGCEFRWGWFQGADNPTVDYRVVPCPSEITAKSGCALK